MTMRHLIDGLMQATNSPNHHVLGLVVGIDKATISRIQSGKQPNMHINTMSQIQHCSRVPFDTLFMWLRMPEGAVLGRIKEMR